MGWYRVPLTSPKVQFGAWSSQFCTKCWFIHTPGTYSPILLSQWQTFLEVDVLMCGQFDVLGNNPIHNSLTSLFCPDIDKRTRFLPGWRPKVADVDVNNHLALVLWSHAMTWCSILRCNSYELLGQEECEQTKAMLHSMLRQPGWVEPWTSNPTKHRGSCMCCKHLLGGLTFLLWTNLVDHLLWYPMESTMNVCLSCALESTSLGLLCNCHQMDWNECNDSCWCPVQR